MSRVRVGDVYEDTYRVYRVMRYVRSGPSLNPTLKHVEILCLARKDTTSTPWPGHTCVVTTAWIRNTKKTINSRKLSGIELADAILAT